MVAVTPPMGGDSIALGVTTTRAVVYMNTACHVVLILIRLINDLDELLHMYGLHVLLTIIYWEIFMGKKICDLRKYKDSADLVSVNWK